MSDKFGELTWRKISPLGRLPKKLVPRFLRKEPEAIEEAKEWIDKYGHIILFTQQKSKGWEKVWVTDEGEIYMDDEENEPTLKELDQRLRNVEAPDELYGESIEKKLSYLKEHEKPL